MPTYLDNITIIILRTKKTFTMVNLPRGHCNTADTCTCRTVGRGESLTSRCDDRCDVRPSVCKSSTEGHLFFGRKIFIEKSVKKNYNYLHKI